MQLYMNLEYMSFAEVHRTISPVTVDQLSIITLHPNYFTANTTCHMLKWVPVQGHSH